MKNTENIRMIIRKAPRGDKMDRLTVLTEQTIKEIFKELDEIDVLLKPKDRSEYLRKYYLQNKERISKQAKERYKSKKLLVEADN